MANGNIRGITIEFGGDTTKLGKALDTIFKDGKKVDSALKDVNKSLKFEPKNTELLSQKQALLAKKIDQTKKRLDVLKQAQATLDASGVDKSSDEYMKLRRQIMQAEGQLGAYETQLRRVESTQRGQQSAMEKLESAISDQERELKALKDEYKNYVIEGKESSDAAKELEGRIQQLSGELADNKKSMSNAEKAADKLDRSVDSVGDSAKKAKDGFTVMKGALSDLVSGGIRRAADSMVEFGKSVLNTGIEFDAQMSKVSALSGATGDELEKLRDTAKEMGATTQYTATEAGQGLEYMALAGWDSEQMVKGLPAVLNLAVAASMDLGTASDIVTDDLTAFGMAAEDAAHFSDVLAATSTSSNTDVEQMGEAFKYAASTAGALGYSVEDTSIAVGLMANAGIKGSQAGTSLRTALSNMASPTDAMATAMDKLGISLTDSEGNMLSLQGVMGELRGAIGNVDVALTDSEGNVREYNDIIADMKKNGADLSQIQKVQAASTIFGKNAMAGMLAIIQASPKDYENLTEAIYNCDDAAGSMAKTVNDNLKGDLTKLSSATDALKINLEENVDGPLRKAVQSLTDMISSEEFVKTVEKIGEGLCGVITNVVNGMITAVDFVSNNKEVVIGVIAAIAAAIAAMKIAGLVSSIAAIANPIGLIVTGIMAVIAILAACYAKFEGFRDVVNSVISFVVSIFEAVKPVISAVIDFLIGIVTGWVEMIQSQFEFVASLPGRIADGWSALVDSFNGWVADWQRLGSDIVAVASSIVSGVVGFFTSLKEKVSGIFSAVKAAASNAWNNIKNAVLTPVRAIKDGAINGFTALKDRVASIFNNVKTAITKPVEAAKDTIGRIVEKIKGFFSRMKLSIPKISMPKFPEFHIITKHFSKGPFNFNYPAGIDVSWHKDGGIFTSPTLLHGVGEAGAEAVLPLDMLWKKFDDMADSIVSGMATVMRSYSSGVNGGDIHLDVYLYPNGPKMGEQIVRAYDTYKPRLG